MDQNSSKRLIDVAGVGHDRFMFSIIFGCGKESHGYVINPRGAKAFYENLGKHIKAYEEKLGTIDTSGLDLGTVSPIQRS